MKDHPALEVSAGSSVVASTEGKYEPSTGWLHRGPLSGHFPDEIFVFVFLGGVTVHTFYKRKEISRGGGLGATRINTNLFKLTDAILG